MDAVAMFIGSPGGWANAFLNVGKPALKKAMALHEAMIHLPRSH